MPIKDFILQSLAADEEIGMTRKLNYFSNKPGSEQLLDGRPLVMLSSNNYLGIAGNEEIYDSAMGLAKQFGTGSCASRTISGSLEIHKECERRIKLFKKSEEALLLANGYMANLAVLTSIPQNGDLILSDELNHASIIDGCKLSKAKVRVFKHKNLVDVIANLNDREVFNNVFLVTDGVFSMDGDIAPLVEYVSLAQKYDLTLIVDDAHGVGTIGKNGLGTASHLNIPPEQIDITIGTLGKAVGCYGAYIACSLEIKQFLINRARQFIFTTSLPPIVAAMVICALDFIEQNGDSLVSELQKKSEYYKSKVAELNIDTLGSQTNIVPLLTGDISSTLEISAKLLELGVFAFGIRPPAVPRGMGRLRTTIIRSHTYGEIDFCVKQIEKAFKI